MKIMLPNSLPKRPKVDLSLSGHGLEWLYIYCASCGADGGRVLETDIPNREEFAFYLCDPCAEKYGQIDGAYMVPDEVFFQKVREAARESLGKELTASEALIELDDATSFLHKLSRKSFVASE